MNEHDQVRDGPEIRLKLNTPENLRKSLARIARMTVNGQLTHDRARATCYVLSTMCKAWDLERDTDVEERLERVEAVLAREGKHLSAL